MCVCVCEWVSVCVCVCVYVYVCVCVCVCVSGSVGQWLSVYVCVWVGVWVCVWVGEFIRYTCMCVCMYVCVCEWVCGWVYQVYMYVCVWYTLACVCVVTVVCVCVCMFVCNVCQPHGSMYKINAVNISSKCNTHYFRLVASQTYVAVYIKWRCVYNQDTFCSLKRICIVQINLPLKWGHLIRPKPDPVPMLSIIESSYLHVSNKLLWKHTIIIYLYIICLVPAYRILLQLINQ